MLTAEHHTVYIIGSWDSFAETPYPIDLPDPTTCKGRKYRIVVVNTASYTLPSTDPNPAIASFVNEFGWAAYILNEDYRAIDGVGNGDARQELPADRAIILQSDGVRWFQLQDDKLDPFDLNNN